MTLKERLHEIIFEADTPAGKAFDVSLLVVIVLSVISVMLESVQHINALYGDYFYMFEWIVTIFFTIEYILRLYSIDKPLKYVFSFMGLVDLLSIMPVFVSLYFAGSHSLQIIRTIRLLRVFRLFKLRALVSEASSLMNALRASRDKLTVFLGAIIVLVLIFGTVMFVVEGGENGFTSIPKSIYWAIVTLTTVGYGDIAPQTVLGQSIASFIMVMGYAIIAVPTGIVTSELTRGEYKAITTRSCPACSKEGHDLDASNCKFCGNSLVS